MKERTETLLRVVIYYVFSIISPPSHPRTHFAGKKKKKGKKKDKNEAREKPNRPAIAEKLSAEKILLWRVMPKKEKKKKEKKGGKKGKGSSIELVDQTASGEKKGRREKRRGGGRKCPAHPWPDHCRRLR